jgi:pyruvate formate lyase activating enzyme
MKDIIGTVLRFEYASMYDGPGLRTVMFLKGCPLRCKWCSTPESQLGYPENGYMSNRCIGCGNCIPSCPEEALSLQQGKVVCDKARCKHCFKCVSICPQSAFKPYGKRMTVQEAMNNLLKDEIFFFHSGGGVTISGGEVLIQVDFAAEILARCKNHGIHTAIETSLYGSYDQAKKMLPHLDLLIVDIKHMDGQKHYTWTGVDNKGILENIQLADESPHQFEIMVRVPLIPGVNDDDGNLLETIEFCENLKKIKMIEPLPYHRLGAGTYEQLGRSYEMTHCSPMSADQIKKRLDFMAKMSPSILIKGQG